MTTNRTRRLGVRAALGGIAVAVLGLTLVVPTSAAYVAQPAATSLQTPASLSWKMPQTSLPLPVIDAAYDSRSGRTYMVAGAGDSGGGLYASPSPGAPTVFLQIGDDTGYLFTRIYAVAVDSESSSLWVATRRTSVSDLHIARYEIAPDGALTFVAASALEHGTGASAIALDADGGSVAVAYGSATADGLGHVAVFQGSGNPMVRTAFNSRPMSFDEILGLSFAASAGEVRAFVALRSVPDEWRTDACWDDACHIVGTVGSGLSASGPDTVWRSWELYVAVQNFVGTTFEIEPAFRGPSGAAFVGASSGDSGYQFFVDRSTKEILKLDRATLAGGPSDRISANAPVRQLISGDGVVLALFTDGSIGWLLT